MTGTAGMTETAGMTGKARASLAFLGWTVVGAGGVLSMLTVLTIGIFVLPCTALLAGLLAWRARGRQLGPGLLTGFGLIPLYIAYLNRGGPGSVCTTSALSQSCTQEMSPWPWAAAGLCLAGAGIALGLLRNRSRQPAGS
jgi:hypothetical protein